MPAVATHTIRVFGDPVLKRPTAEVTDIDGRLVKLVDAMYETMHDAPGVGLAAPQVGVQKRFFVYELPDDDGPHVLLNPHVVEATGEWDYEEGCLSLPGLRGLVPRAQRIHYRGVGLDGEPIERTVSGFHARVVQHECDHLDGRLYPSRMTDLDTLGFVEEQARAAAEVHDGE